jgi:anti-anti-sigma factor
VSDDYLLAWTEQRGLVTVLKVRGELDAVTAGRFATGAASELRHASGPVAVDLTFLDFIDCSGARALSQVIKSVQPWRLVEVSGIQVTVARVLALVGTDLSAPSGPRDPTLSLCGREPTAQSHPAGSVDGHKMGLPPVTARRAPEM